MKYITLIMLVFSTFSFSEKKEIICELEGSFSVTYRDLSKTVISEGLDFFKNLATQTQQSIFLINKAKTNFDKDDWQKESLQVVQYWEIDESDNLIKLNYTFDPSPIWVNPKANWSKKISENGIEVISSMTLGEDHPLFDNYSVEYYGISNSINWYTGKGRIFGDIWLKSKDGGKNNKNMIFTYFLILLFFLCFVIQTYFSYFSLCKRRRGTRIGGNGSYKLPGAP